MKLNNFRFGSLVAIIFILFFPLTANADDRHAQVDKIFAPWDKTSSPGCAVMIIKDGRIDYAHGYGMTHLEHGIPNSPQTIYRIGSTSKQFTAMCIAMLEARDQLSLEDDIRQYLPELRAYDTPIKIKHLIHHQSGLPDYLGLNRSFFYTPADSLKDLASVEKLLFLPGEKYQYSNSNYFLLSILVERITGSTLNQFATENIFQPLGMVHTHFHDDRNLIVPHRAQGYSPRRDGEGFRINITQLEHCGDGGIFTSLEDMYLWDQAFYHNNLGKELIERVQTPGLFNDGKKSNYAFGLTLGNYKGFRTVGHGGSFVGYKSVLLRFPEQKLTIVILANLSTMNPSRLARQVADLYLPRIQIYPEAEWLQVSSPEDFGYSSVKPLRLPLT